jgi:ribosome maturation factor RimP
MTALTNKTKLKTIQSTLNQWIAPHGYEVIDIELQTHQGIQLRIFIDRNYETHPLDESSLAPESIGLADVMTVNQVLHAPVAEGPTKEEALEELIDQLQLISPKSKNSASSYDLEISSPGVYRKLNSRQDFERFLGSRVRVVILQTSQDDPEKIRPGAKLQKTLVGILKQTTEQGFFLQIAEQKKKKHLAQQETQPLFIQWEKMSKANLDPDFTFTGESKNV